MPDHDNAWAAYVGDIYHEDPTIERVHTPLWRESMFALEWVQLRMSPVYWGCGVPRGRGEPVLLVPGFLASDISMMELWGWLLRMGYQPYFSHIARNIDCPNATAEAVLATARRIHRDSGKPVTLIGHSLGGMLARSVALDHPEIVRLVVTLGSPFRDNVRAHPAVMTAAHTISARGPDSPATANVTPTCFTGHCTCNYTKNVLQPGQFGMPRYAIYSRKDGVADWASCIEDDPALNIEVDATHLGMVFHAGVFRILGRLLADPGARPQPAP